MLIRNLKFFFTVSIILNCTYYITVPSLNKFEQVSPKSTIYIQEKHKCLIDIENVIILT